MCKQRESENARLEADLTEMRNKMNFLVRAVSHPDTLSSQEQQRLKLLILQEAARQVAGEDPELSRICRSESAASSMAQSSLK